MSNNKIVVYRIGCYWVSVNSSSKDLYDIGKKFTYVVKWLIRGRVENIDSHISQIQKAQSRKVSSIEPPISSFSRRKFKRKLVISLSFFAEKVFF